MRWKPKEKKVKKAQKWKRRFALFPTECKNQHGERVKVWLEFYLVYEELKYSFHGVWTEYDRRIIEKDI